MLRWIMNVADFALPAIPLLVFGQATMNAFPLTGGVFGSFPNILVVAAVALPLLAWWLYAMDRLLRARRA